MTTKPNFKPSSYLLLSAVIATSFLMVNCNKGGDKGVRAQTVKNDKTNNKLDGKKEACSANVLKTYGSMNKEYERVMKLHKKNQAAAGKEKLKVEFEKVLKACDLLGQDFDKEKIAQCIMSSKVDLPKAPNQCSNIAKLLFKEDGTETPYLKLANDQEKAAKKDGETKSFKTAKLLMSEEIKTMLLAENLDFKMYIVDGEIKTNRAELEKAYKDKKVVCSFYGTTTPVPENKKVFLTLGANEVTEITENIDPIIINAVGLSMNISTEVADDVSGQYVTLGCSHLSKDKIDIELLKKALGKHLAAEGKPVKEVGPLKNPEKPEPKAAATEESTEVKSAFRKSEITEMNK